MIRLSMKDHVEKENWFADGPTKKLLPITLALWFCTACATLLPADRSADMDSVNEIKAARAAFNQAIYDADMNGIAAALTEEVILITGTDSDLYQGCDAQVALWQSDADDPVRLICERTPTRVQPSQLHPIASETGIWVCHARGDTANTVTGDYSAKWRRSHGAWRVEAETFTTLACTGTFCNNTSVEAE